MIGEIRNEPRLDEKVPIQVAGDPEKKISRERTKKGIPLKEAEYAAIKKIGKECGVRLLLK